MRSMNAIKSSAASNWVYQNLFKRNSSYFTLILVGAIIVESGVSRSVDFWWNSVNKGVRHPPRPKPLRHPAFQFDLLCFFFASTEDVERFQEDAAPQDPGQEGRCRCC
jgi:hypothetical protein